MFRHHEELSLSCLKMGKKHLSLLMIISQVRVSSSQMCINEGFDQQYKKDVCLAFSEEDFDLRVVGGESINVTDAPWHAVITSGGNGMLMASNMLGGGNLITTRLVLTAAHLFWSNSRNRRPCPKEMRELESASACHALENECPRACGRVMKESIEIFFGVTEMKYDQPIGHKISHLHFHPGFNKRSLSNDISDGHDIAILRTSIPVELSPSVQPICLPHPNLENDIGIPEQDVSVNGFGRDESWVSVAETLQHGCLYIVDKLECQKAIEPLVEKNPYIFKNGTWNGDQICAQGAGVNSCNGDSGGGLVVILNNTNVIIGVTSFGTSSCSSNVPGMYTNILSHLDWIRENIVNEELFGTETDLILDLTENSTKANADGSEGRLNNEGELFGEETDLNEH